MAARQVHNKWTNGSSAGAQQMNVVGTAWEIGWWRTRSEGGGSSAACAACTLARLLRSIWNASARPALMPASDSGAGADGSAGFSTTGSGGLKNTGKGDPPIAAPFTSTLS